MRAVPRQQEQLSWIYPVAVLATACPEVGGASPFSILNVVLFPAPLGPRSPKHYIEKRHR